MHMLCHKIMKWDVKQNKNEMLELKQKKKDLAYEKRVARIVCKWTTKEIKASKRKGMERKRANKTISKAWIRVKKRVALTLKGANQDGGALQDHKQSWKEENIEKLNGSNDKELVVFQDLIHI